MSEKQKNLVLVKNKKNLVLVKNKKTWSSWTAMVDQLIWTSDRMMSFTFKNRNVSGASLSRHESWLNWFVEFYNCKCVRLLCVCVCVFQCLSTHSLLCDVTLSCSCLSLSNSFIRSCSSLFIRRSPYCFFTHSSIHLDINHPSIIHSYVHHLLSIHLFNPSIYTLICLYIPPSVHLFLSSLPPSFLLSSLSLPPSFLPSLPSLPPSFSLSLPPFTALFFFPGGTMGT